jgi:enoyl-CoA hydratase/carnithine racemase
MPNVELEHFDGDAVAVLTLDDEISSNAMSVEMGEAFKRQVRDIQADPKLRAVIIRAKGEDFSIGCPRDLLVEFGSGALTGGKLRAAIVDYSNLWLPILDLPVPVISIITGKCFGVGLFFVCAADVAIVDETANLQILDAALGYFPGMALSFLLERKVGVQQASLLTMAQEAVSAREAERLGLVARCVAVGRAFDEGKRLAQAIAAAAPEVVRNIKKDLRVPLKRLLSEIEDGAAQQAKDFQTREFRTRIANSSFLGDG